LNFLSAVGGLTQGTTVGGNFVAFDQIGGTGHVTQTAGMTGPPLCACPGVIGVFFSGDSSLTAVFTTTAGGQGVYPIEMSNIGVGFFGITGPQTLGSYTVVPEPTTAALMGLGLAMRRQG